MIALQCNNKFGMAMSFVGNPSDKMLAWLMEQVAEIRSYTPPPSKKVARLNRINGQRASGKSLEEIGEAEGITKQRVSQILKGTAD